MASLVFAIMLMGKRESWLLYFNCLPVSVLMLFLTLSYVDLQCVIVVFPDHTHLLFFPNDLIRFISALNKLGDFL